MRTKQFINGETPTPETESSITSNISERSDSQTTGGRKLVSEIVALVESDITYNQLKLSELQSYDANDNKDASAGIERFTQIIAKHQRWLTTLQGLNQNEPIPTETHFYN